MKYFSEVTSGFYALIKPEECGALKKYEFFCIEAGLSFCEAFLPHEPPSTELVEILLTNHKSLVNWGVLEGEKHLSTLLTLLPQMGGINWRGLLKQYHLIPERNRCYSIDLDKKLFFPTATPPSLRRRYLNSLFIEPIALNKTKIIRLPDPKIGAEPLTVRAITARATEQIESQIAIPNWLHLAGIEAEQNLPPTRQCFSSLNKPESIRINMDELLEIAKKMDLKDEKLGFKSKNLAKRCKNLSLDEIRYLKSTLPDEIVQAHEILIDRWCHVIGKPSSGKSTLIEILIAWLCEKGYRVAVICASTQTAHHQSLRYKRLGYSATAWCGTRGRSEHGQRGYLSNEQLIPIVDGLSVMGNLKGGCLLRSLQSPALTDTFHNAVVPPGAEDGICLRLRYKDQKQNTDNNCICPLHALCPQFEQEREVRIAQAIFLTMEAWVSSRPSPLYFPSYKSIPDWLIDNVDIVIVDEADSVQRKLDDIFTVRDELYGPQGCGGKVNEECSRLIRQFNNAGSMDKLEEASNAGANLFQFSKFGIYIMSELNHLNIGKILLSRPINESGLLIAAITQLRFFKRAKEKANSAKCIQEYEILLNRIMDVLNLTTWLEKIARKQRIKSADQSLLEVEEMINQKYPEYDHLTRALAWSFYRLLKRCENREAHQRRPEEDIIAYCEDLWNESINLSDDTKLKGGFEQLRNICSHWKPGGSSHKAVQDEIAARESAMKLTLIVVAYTRLILHTYARVSYPAQILAQEELITGTAMGDVARKRRIYRQLLPSPLLKQANTLIFEKSASGYTLTYQRLIGPGRALLYFLNDKNDISGKKEPHIFLASGTSYAGTGMKLATPDVNEKDLASPIYDIDLPVNYILEQPQEEQFAITQTSNYFGRILLDKNNQPLKVSGSPLHERSSKAAEIASRLIIPSKAGIPSIVEDDFTDAERKWGKAAMFGRRRLLLVASSYAMVDKIIKELSVRFTGTWNIVGVRQDAFRIKQTSPPLPENCHWLCASDVERFGDFPEQSVLIAPLNAISRGHNILTRTPYYDHPVAAISHIYFLSRPLPHPGDLSAVIGFHNRALIKLMKQNYLSLASNGEGTLELFERIRKSLNIRFEQAQKAHKTFRDMDEETRLRFVFQVLIPIWQTICRGVRGGVPVQVGFVDSAFYPLTSIGKEDNEASSLLLAMDELLRRVVNPSENDHAILAKRMFDSPLEAFSKMTVVSPKQLDATDSINNVSTETVLDEFISTSSEDFDNDDAIDEDFEDEEWADCWNDEDGFDLDSDNELSV